MRKSAQMYDWIRNQIKKAGGVRARDYRIPVLCYHSWRMENAEYENNDLVALASDLRVLTSLGYQVLSVTTLIDILAGLVPARIVYGKKAICLTFDDGVDYDYYDHQVEELGVVHSVSSILDDSARSLPLIGEGPMAVSFVIASPHAREILDKTCNASTNRWGDSWWKGSAEHNLLGIGNHSWDHVHDTLPSVNQRDNLKGSFYAVDTFTDAENQIAKAQHYINTVTGGNAMPAFAYPYGHVSGYLRDEYFPEHGERSGLRAAFSTAGTSVSPDTCIWDIPRFVCGYHWRSSEEFIQLIDAVERGEL